jgi:hypothetical protein
MNTSSDIDFLVRSWGRKRAPAQADLDDLQRSIMKQVAEQTILPAKPATKVGWQWRMASVVGLVSLAGVVAFLCSFNTSLIHQPFAKETPADSSLVQQFPESHFREMARELRTLFGDRLMWIVETSDDLLLGIDSASRKIDDASYVAIRITVLRRSKNQTVWQQVWTEDVVARPEELVQAKSSHSKAQLMLWTHLLPDGAMSIDAHLALPGLETPFKIASVQHPRDSVRVFDELRGTDDYQIWQTAVLLPGQSL